MKNFFALAFAGVFLMGAANSRAAAQYGGPDSIHDGRGNYVERGNSRSFQYGQYRVTVKPRLNAEQTRAAVEELKARQARASAKIEAAKRVPVVRENVVPKSPVREIPNQRIPQQLRLAFEKIRDACPGARIISDCRPGETWGHHRTCEAIDVVAPDYDCVYAQLKDFPGGVSRDAHTMNFNPRHIHLSYAPGKIEWGCWFNHMGIHGGTGSGPRCQKLIHVGGNNFRKVVWADEKPVQLASLGDEPIRRTDDSLSRIERFHGKRAVEMVRLMDAEAKSYGIDLTTQRAITQIESGFDPTKRPIPKGHTKPTSPAYGLCQIIDFYWPHLKLPKTPTPEQQARACAVVTAENTGVLREALDREPTREELYLAHFQGATAALAIMRADKNAKVVDILNSLQPGMGWKVMEANKHMWSTPTTGAFLKWIDKRMREALVVVSGN